MKLSALFKAGLLFTLITIKPAFAATQTLDVLITYDNRATTVTQGKDMPALAATFIAYANQTYKRSNVGLKLRMVALKKVSVASGSSVSSTALRNLARDKNIAKMRTQYGADLVVMLTLRKNVSGGFLCGIGYIPGGNNGKLYPGSKNAGYSVSAVNCGYPTFVHELGHNLGLGHSFAQKSNGRVFTWGRGHGVYNNFATIMAYPQAYGRAKRVQQFSSPTQRKCNGLPCGVAHNRTDAADAVASINAVAKQVASFNPTKVRNVTVSNAPKPKASPKPKVTNLVRNGNFDSLGSWRNFWNLSSIQRTGYKVASKYGLKAAKRKAFYAGPVQTLSLKTGKTYQLSAYAALATSYQARNNMFAGLLLTTPKGLRLQPLAKKSIVKGQWSKLTATFKVNTSYGKPSKVELLFYGPSSGRDFYLDEVIVKPK